MTIRNGGAAHGRAPSLSEILARESMDYRGTVGGK